MPFAKGGRNKIISKNKNSTCRTHFGGGKGKEGKWSGLRGRRLAIRFVEERGKRLEKRTKGGMRGDPIGFASDEKIRKKEGLESDKGPSRKK